MRLNTTSPDNECKVAAALEEEDMDRPPVKLSDEQIAPDCSLALYPPSVLLSAHSPLAHARGLFMSNNALTCASIKLLSHRSTCVCLHVCACVCVLDYVVVVYVSMCLCLPCCVPVFLVVQRCPAVLAPHTNWPPSERI